MTVWKWKVTDSIPPKNPRFRSVKSRFSQTQREQKVRYFVEQSKLPPFFSVIRGATGIPDKQLARTLKSLHMTGYYPVLRWVDRCLPPRSVGGDGSESSTAPSRQFHQDDGPGGWWLMDHIAKGDLTSILFMEFILERSPTRREFLGACKNKVAAGRWLEKHVANGDLVYQTRHGGRRGRPREVLVVAEGIG